MSKADLAHGIAALREFYARGADSLAKHLRLPRQELNNLPEEDWKRARSEAETLLKARTFADPKKGYSKQEL